NRRSWCSSKSRARRSGVGRLSKIALVVSGAFTSGKRTSHEKRWGPLFLPLRRDRPARLGEQRVSGDRASHGAADPGVGGELAQAGDALDLGAEVPFPEPL